MQDSKIAKNRNLCTIAQLCRVISLQLRHISTIGKSLLSSNISPTCPYNIVNFGLLAAEIFSLVWGTPANFSGFRDLAALLHGTRRQRNFAALNRGRHLYLAEAAITLGIGPLFFFYNLLGIYFCFFFYVLRDIDFISLHLHCKWSVSHYAFLINK